MTISTSLDLQSGETSAGYIERLRSLLVEERGFPKSSDPFGPIDYIAHIIYAYEAAAEGHSVIRWGAMREIIRDKYREKATQTIASWSIEQIMIAKANQ